MALKLLPVLSRIPNGGAILGKKTFGKGVVQQRFPLNALEKEGAVSFTISTYYTPSGVSINEKGIEPNIEVEMSKLDEITAAMRLYARKYVETFVEDWIERTEKEMGENSQRFCSVGARTPRIDGDTCGKQNHTRY